jgi:uncharacterized membrane protein YccC
MHDPGLRALRRALRTTVAATIVFYFGMFVVDDEQFAVLAVFAVIGVNGLADFGGPNRSRFLANAALIATGVPLVAIGTWVSESTAEATILMLVIVFLVGYMCIYSGYVAAGANVVILFYVVACAIPASRSAIDDRVLGFLFGGAFAVLASVIWPLHERATFRSVLAQAARAVSNALASLADGAEAEWERRRDEAHAGVRGLRPTLAQTTLRPVGPTSRDRAEIYVIYALGRLRGMLANLEHCRDRLHTADRHRQLESLATALASTADTLDGRSPGVDIGSLRHAVDAFEQSSDQRLEDELTAGGNPAAFAADADADLALREVGAVTVVVAVNARLAAGLAVPAPPAPIEPGAPMLDPRGVGVLDAAWRRARTNFTLSSVATRNALRLALGLAVARLLVGVFDLQHGFWVVFGTLTVMKSNVGGTRATVLKAVLGTAIGFAVAAVLLTAFEGDHDIWLVLLPAALFLAMYLIGNYFAAGQAFFTITIVTLFRIIAPASWTLALLRLEDMAIGAGVGLLIGVLAWPRGAGGQLRDSIARLLDSGRRYAELTARQLLSGAEAPHDIAGARAQTVAATRRADDVFTQYLTEAGSRPVPLEVWADLLSAALRLWYSTETIRLHTRGHDVGTDPVCLDLVGLLEQATDRLDAGFAETASALRGGTTVAVAQPLPTEATGPLLSACAASLHNETDRARLARALRVIEVREWLLTLSEDLVGLSEPVGKVAAGLGPGRGR